MARHTFGGGTGDYVADSTGRALSSRTVTFYDAATGGTQITDLLVDGSPATTVTSGAAGRIPVFQGPDGVTALWADAGGSFRSRMDASDDELPSEAAIDTRVSTLVADPASDLGAALAAKLAADTASSTYAAKRRGRDRLRPAEPAKVMSSPPTVTVNTAVTGYATTIVGSTNYTWPSSGGNLSGTITHLGGAPNPTQSSAINISMAASGNASFAPWANEFMVYGDAFELFQSNQAAGSFRLKVDDEYVSLTPTALSAVDANQTRILVTFPSVALRKITVENDNLRLAGLRVGATHSYHATAVNDEPWAFLGHSFIDGTGASSRLLAMQFSFARALRLGNLWSLGQGGTGYLNPATGSKKTYINRLVDVAAAGAKVLCISGPVNDVPSKNAAYTSSALQTAVSTLLTAIPTSCPTVERVFVGGYEFASGSPSAEQTAAHAAVSAAVAAADIGIPVSFIDTTGWISGSGKAGAATATGNSNHFIASDGVHYTDAGHEYLGNRWAERVAAALDAA